MRPALALLDVNLKFLTAPNNDTSKETKRHNNQSRNPSIAESLEYASNFSSKDSRTGSVDFSSPTQYSFNTPYYPIESPVSTSLASFAVANHDFEQLQDFGFEMGEDVTRLWNG